jgi:hypothetical protein
MSTLAWPLFLKTSTKPNPRVTAAAAHSEMTLRAQARANAPACLRLLIRTVCGG